MLVGSAAGSGAGWTPVGLKVTGAKPSPVTLTPNRFPEDADAPRWEALPERALEAGGVYELVIKARAVNPKSTGTTALKAALLPVSDGKRKPLFACGPALAAEFETFTAPFQIKKDVSRDQYRLALSHGFGDADIEVHSMFIRELDRTKALNAYHRTGRWYAGQEPDAPWRAKARQMIEKNRKADFTIEVIDRSGNPVPGARIILQQKKHAYRFGVAANSMLWRYYADEPERSRMLQSELDYYRQQSGRTTLTMDERREEIKTYFEVLQRDFNYVVYENAMKWAAWSGDWGGIYRDDTLEMADWLDDQGIALKGHVMVWPSWRHSPSFVKSFAEKPDELNRLVHAHITDIGHVFKDRVVVCDVLNETFNNHDYMDVMGRDVMAGWFKQTAEVMPDVQLNINDFKILANGGHWTEKLDYYDDHAAGLIAEGAPLGGIGFQSHFRHAFLTSPERVWELCDRFAKHGVPLSVSEYDADLPDEQLQAEFLRDFMSAWFAHPDTEAFVQWGFWQGSHWLPYAGLYDLDWRMKPNGAMYRDLVYNQWWSGWLEEKTGADGTVELRGFMGTYHLSVYADGVEKEFDQVELKRDGTRLSIRL